MGASHRHTPADIGSEGSLRLALALTGTYLVVEVAGGLLTGSLALLSDAASSWTWRRS